ncbi:MAG: hopanoid biosynthesis associated radical SAM protein HpnH [Omnitrophica WOR_2 bacterium RIFCSPLOWO2_12_FULL_51_24]|nr:MAG: hopanoid biosynthesis associated radical SAM protein HpnH [Omnitrophica WOR_2 bacterium RIFCSPHIGHO2_01_FULL_49_10]OGX42969.1 MAG: hopanoid biosynthesis associated radical SAM protein HpnH [Omnitrophica WOR_2 bacterium RIFCSPLOWO2_12_FULL_51_24]
MRFKPGLTAKVTKHIISNKIKKNKRFSLVLMLEPTFMCNLSCEGCGRIREYKRDLHKMLSVAECLKAVEECGAPIVSICGGEPLVYPYLGELIEKLTRRGKYIYLCTNGLLFKDKIDKLKPNGNLMINFHVDGLEKTHDAITGLKGAYARVLGAIKSAKKKRFFVCTNTTIYKQTDINELKQLFKTLRGAGVDGFLISPAYGYAHVGESFFFRKSELADFFEKLEPEFRKYNFLGSPLYLEFVQGKRELDCAPWATPTRNPIGWRSPCYQLADRHFSSYKELIEKTDWKRYGPKSKNPRCAECAVHCGFEPASVLEGKSFRDIMTLIGWQFA